MLSLGIVMALQDAEFGAYGETLWWNTSPVMDSGAVTDSNGIWVNSLPVSVSGDTYTDNVTISTRYADVLEQAKVINKLLYWVANDLRNVCKLSCNPILDMELPIVSVKPLNGASYDAVDSEGHWVISISFSVAYKLPKPVE